MVHPSEGTETNRKNFLKTFEKPLDKLKKMCYNKYVIERENLTK